MRQKDNNIGESTNKLKIIISTVFYPYNNSNNLIPFIISQKVLK